MNYPWNWHIFWETSTDGVNTYMSTLMSGLLWTLAVALTAWIMALLLGAIVGTLRTLPQRWVVMICNGYVEFFRNIPLLVQMFLWFYVLPEVLPQAMGDWLKSLPNMPFIAAVLSLGFFTSARVAVQLTSGIQSLPRGQKMAGTALGLTLPQTYRYILLPMAMRVVFAPLTSEFVNIIKNSSVALSIGVIELMSATRAMADFSFTIFEALTVATLIYIIVNIIVIFCMRALEKFMAVPGFITAGGH